MANCLKYVRLKVCPADPGSWSEAAWDQGEDSRGESAFDAVPVFRAARRCSASDQRDSRADGWESGCEKRLPRAAVLL